MFLFLFLHFILSSVSASDTQTSIRESPESCKDIDNCRTLSSITWSCITTIFLCTWIAIHPNIPAPESDDADSSSWQWIRSGAIKFLRRRVLLFVVALIFPEYILSWAIRQRLVAREMIKQNVELRMTRSQAFFIAMGGFYGKKASSFYPFHRNQVIALLHSHSINLPTKYEIQDKSKNDWIAKALVILQTLWFIAQCIARGVQHLPITELEVVTLAYTIINLGVYIAWWDKPKDIECPVVVEQEPPANDDSKRDDHWMPLSIGYLGGYQDSLIKLDKRIEIPVFYSGDPGPKHMILTAFATLVMGGVFGAAHFIAWNSSFPTTMALKLWRLSSVAILGIPLLMLFLPFTLVSLGLGAQNMKDGPHVEDEEALKASSPRAIFIVVFLALCTPIYILIPFLFLAYIAARIVTIYISLLTLRSLPMAAYSTIQWTTLIPHL